jgi:hypothetical protein
MAHFYGTVQGDRGEASRMGGKRGGLTTQAASWQGSVRTRLYEKDGQDYALVSLEPWQGAGVSKVLYDGPVGGEK